MNIINELGSLALGTRLKRLSDQIMRSGAKLYQTHQIDFEPKWFPVIYLLNQESPLGIMEIANRLGFTHPAVSQMVSELEKNGLIRSEKDKNDNRKRMISLTDKSKALIQKMTPIWEDITKAMQLMLSTHQHNILFSLDEMEASFEEKELFTRVQEVSKLRQLDDISIIDYAPAYQKDFERLNYEWVVKYFKLEEIDKKMLADPENMIIRKGGHIIFARYQEEIIGTCALIKKDEKTYELAKMGVTEKARGKQVGKKLGLAIIDKARAIGAETIILLSNTKLTPAISLYKKLGFRSIEMSLSGEDYERANIKMELVL